MHALNGLGRLSSVLKVNSKVLTPGLTCCTETELIQAFHNTEEGSLHLLEFSGSIAYLPISDPVETQNTHKSLIYCEEMKCLCTETNGLKQILSIHTTTWTHLILV